MAKVKQTVTTTKKTYYKKKTGGNTGYKVCSNCGGDGRVKVRKS